MQNVMNKFEQALEKYHAEAKKLGLSIDPPLLKAVTRGLGPSIYRVDSSKVSCSDQSELDRVKQNFLIKKLGLNESDGLDEAIKDVCKQFGKSRSKYRALFYYLLTVKFGKESHYTIEA